jgi:hypothetical protein
VGGVVSLLPRDLVSAASPTPWLQLRDGVPVTHLIGTAP